MCWKSEEAYSNTFSSMTLEYLLYVIIHYGTLDAHIEPFQISMMGLFCVIGSSITDNRQGPKYASALHIILSLLEKCAFSEFFWSVFSRIRWDAPYLSVFNPNAGKYGPEKLRMRTLFKYCILYFNIFVLHNPYCFITTKNNLMLMVKRVWLYNFHFSTRCKNKYSITTY